MGVFVDLLCFFILFWVNFHKILYILFNFSACLYEQYTRIGILIF